jgi:YVTN family beta-propeller protein
MTSDGILVGLRPGCDEDAWPDDGLPLEGSGGAQDRRGNARTGNDDRTTGERHMTAGIPFPSLRRGLAAVAAVAALAAPAAAQAPTAGPSVKLGAGLYEIAVSQTTGTVYVASTGPRGEPGARVFALDPATLATRAEIDVSAAPAFGLGINDRTQTLYTSNTRSRSVSAIDLASGRVVATITTPLDTVAHLREVVVDETRNLVYVSSYDDPGKIWVIDGATNTLRTVIDNVGKGTSGMALDVAANRIYATNMQGGDISVVDLASGRVERTFSAGGGRPSNAVLDPATHRLFVANQETGNLTVLDARSGQLLQTVATGAGALGVSFHAPSNRVYVANRGAGTVTVIDGASYQVVASLATGTHPNTVAIHRASGAAFVTNKARSAGRGQPPVNDPNGDTVSRINP